MHVYEIYDEKFKVEEIEKDYNHFVFSNPFKGDETLFEVINILVAIAKYECLGVCNTYAHAYAMSMFGTDFFPDNINIFYIFQTKEDYDYGVPRDILWEYKLKGEK